MNGWTNMKIIIIYDYSIGIMDIMEVGFTNPKNIVLISAILLTRNEPPLFQWQILIPLLFLLSFTYFDWKLVTMMKSVLGRVLKEQ